MMMTCRMRNPKIDGIVDKKLGIKYWHNVIKAQPKIIVYSKEHVIEAAIRVTKYPLSVHVLKQI